MRMLLALGCALMLTPSAVAADPPKEKPADKVICKRIYDADTGSHFRSSRRVCRKASDWDQLDRETDEAMRSFRDNARPGDIPSTHGLGSDPE